MSDAFEGLRGGFYLVGVCENWGKTPGNEGWPDGYRMRVDVGGVEPETVICDYADAEAMNATQIQKGDAVVLRVAPKSGRNGVFLSLRGVEGFSRPLAAAASSNGASAPSRATSAA